MKRLVGISLVLLLTACGGGGGGASPQAQSVTAQINPAFSIAQHVTANVTNGTPCVDVANTDAMFGNMLNWALPLNEPPWACNIVSSANGYPVASGTESMRFENHPSDCPGESPSPAYPTGWRDCEQDRSRNEVIEKSNIGSSANRLVTYEYKVYIPRQERLKPKGNNLLVLSQIRFSASNGGEPAGALAYLFAYSNDSLGIRIHKDWSWNSVGDIEVKTSPIYDRWIPVKWEVLATDTTQGYIKVWVDGVLVTTATNRSTIPTSDGLIRIKYGIYNSFKSNATEPFANQVVYFDDMTKVVR